MMGSFRLVKDCEAQFYELLVITRDGDDLVMKVRLAVSILGASPG